jgi:hypothetical protein
VINVAVINLLNLMNTIYLFTGIRISTRGNGPGRVENGLTTARTFFFAILLKYLRCQRPEFKKSVA